MSLISLHSAHLLLWALSLVLLLVAIFFLVSSLHALGQLQTSLKLASTWLRKRTPAGSNSLLPLSSYKMPSTSKETFSVTRLSASVEILSRLKDAWRMIVAWRENRSVRETEHKGWTRLSAITICGVLFLGAYGIARQQPKYPIEKHHNVYVWSQVKGAQNSWWVSGNDLPFSRWDCCPDFPCATVIWPGYIADTFKYEERGKCKSIRSSGLGAFWERDQFGNVKEW
jgi:hypothetical protein